MLRSLSRRGLPACRSSRFFALLALSGALSAQVLPDRLGTVPKSPAKAAVRVPDQALFNEYGFDSAGQARYGKMTVAYWRFHDSTGALAAFQYLRPADAQPSKLDKLAVTIPDGAIVAHGNYVFKFAGHAPTETELAQIVQSVPELDQSALPVLSYDLPQENLIPNSQRYLLGPVGLQEVDPSIPPSVAAFHLSAEGQYGRYSSKAGDLNLTIFNYPTPDMARDQVKAFRKISGTVAKRAGPLVAVITNSPNPDAAERLLALISYHSSIVWDQQTPQQASVNFARAILTMFLLAGLIILFCLCAGLAYAGFRILSRRMLGNKSADPEMITLHLSGK
jgi:Family of unknown function (DUF6599)